MALEAGDGATNPSVIDFRPPWQGIEEEALRRRLGHITKSVKYTPLEPTWVW
jgi:hypothetical protein